MVGELYVTMKITSVNNELIKETAKLLMPKYRNKEQLFLIEGEKCINEAIKYGLQIVRIFSVSGFENHPQRIEVTEAVMSKISDAKTPPKAVAVLKQLTPTWSENYKKVILLENIKDPGNLGTILRSAAAFGIDAVVLYGDTVDLYNPKTVRSAVGNLWKIPVFKLNDLTKFKDYERVATLPSSTDVIKLSDYNPSKRVLVMFGAEADGLSDELKKFATVNVTIEADNKVESLNLSVSASIFMYKLFSA